MLNRLLIGLDLGTTNAKAAAFTPDGDLVAQASSRYPTHFPHPGWAEQMPGDWCEALGKALVDLVAALGNRVDQVVAIGLSAHCPSLVPVDADGAPLLAYSPTWQDERSSAQAQHLIKTIGPEWTGLGMPFAAFAAKLLWFTQEHPQLAMRARYALGIKGYLIHWLTGHYATDPSSEPGSEERWAPVMAACGWSIEKLPPVLPVTGQAGGLRPELAQQVGLKAGLPVVIGMNDGGSAGLASGACRPGDAVIQLGTNGVLYIVLDEPVPAARRVEQAVFCWPYVDAYWIGGGQTKAGGACLQWIANMLDSDKGGSCDAVEALLNTCQESPPGSRGIVFLPYLMGRGTPSFDPLASGSFTGLRMDTTPADMGRAVLEGVAFAIKDIFDVLRQGGNVVRGSAYITGGGSQSALWRQIVADVLNLELRCACSESCLGAAILAAVGVGLYPGVLQAVQAMTHTREVNHPDGRSVHIYDTAYQEYCRVRNLLMSPTASQVAES